MLLFIFLGRSKAEQYFGFLPLFSYFNFLLGYIPLVFSDLTSQLILLSYIFYTLITRILYKFLNLFNQNVLDSVETKYSKGLSYRNLNQQPLANFKFVTLLRSAKPDTLGITVFTKKLYNLNFLVSPLTLTELNFNKLKNPVLSYDLNLSTLLLKSTPHTNNLLHTYLTFDESYYSAENLNTNFKNKNIKISLKLINTINNFYKNPLFFNFNIDNNMLLSKQQRWLARNSLLTENIVPNSFLVTQAKKLTGLNTLNPNFTNKTL